MKYVRYDNIFSEAPGDFLVRVIDVPTMNEDEFCEEVAAFHEGLTAEQAALAVRLFDKAFRNILKRGSSVKTRFLEFRLGAKGHIGADGKKAVKGAVHAHAPKDYDALAAGLAMDEVTGSQTGPALYSVKDSVTGLVDKGLTPGGMAVLLGRNIKVEGGSVKLRNLATGAVTEIAGNLGENKPSTVIFLVPASLPEGVYRVSVETVYSGSSQKPYNLPRSAELDINLPVPPPLEGTGTDTQDGEG